MIVRVGGIITLIYFGIGLFVVAYAVLTGDLFRPMTRIDWDVVPHHMKMPLWLQHHPIWMLFAVAAYGFGSAAIYSRRHFRTSFLLHLILAAMMGLTLLGPFVWLACYDRVPLTDSSYEYYYIEETVLPAIVLTVLLPPTICVWLIWRRKCAADSARDGPTI